MVRKLSKADKKIAYDAKLCQLLDDYSQVLVVAADNVGSTQMQNIRSGLRGDSVILMGKNTMMKRSVRMHSDKTGNKAYLSLIPLLVGNVGLSFTKGDLKEVREEVAKYKVGAPARVGLLAPVDVVVPPGNTGLDPSQTSFFQVLNIPTKINKGTVEIITPVELIQKGDKVGSSEAALLAKLGIRPFSYGLVVTSVYDNGSVFDPLVLDLTEDDLVDKFATGVSMVTSLALAVHYPAIAAAPHMLINGYKNVLALAVETLYSFPLAEKVKVYLNDQESDDDSYDGGYGDGADVVQGVFIFIGDVKDDDVHVYLDKDHVHVFVEHYQNNLNFILYMGCFARSDVFPGSNMIKQASAIMAPQDVVTRQQQPLQVAKRLEKLKTTIFTQMSSLAIEHGAINLGQGFLNFDGPDFVKEAAIHAIKDGKNQYTRGFGVPNE
ncbi:60S acidic ribosomal protein P0 [Tanacetum coccineum]